MSKETLDLCYRDEKWGDDRLAFVLAHEIAHQLKDDFWHLKFFQEVRGSEPLRLAQELQADEYGIVYASMAGFNTDAIVTEDDQVNFFADWIQEVEATLIASCRKQTLPSQTTEDILGVKVEARETETIPHWGPPSEIRLLLLEQESFKVMRYAQGIMILSQAKEIRMISTLEQYQGTSKGRIRIGSAAKEVIAQYGRPTRIVPMSKELAGSMMYKASPSSFETERSSPGSCFKTQKYNGYCIRKQPLVTKKC